jgi:hypothetical protein
LVEPQHRCAAERVRLFDLHVGIGGEQRNEIGRRRLPPVEFAVAERRGGGCIIRHIEPLDPVDFGDLAARGPVGRLTARHIGGILDIDRLMSWLELFGDKFEGARPDGIGDLLIGIGLGEALGHDEGRYARDLGEAS